jgi:hypothetical protein
MKTLPLLLSSILIVGLACANPQQHERPIVLTYQGCEKILMENPRDSESLSLIKEMESLIRNGEFPIVIERDKNVAWIYLNDPNNSRDYPENNLKSDYFEIITDLFPIKINKTLQNSLKRGNKAFFETLGINYFVKEDEVFSKINYEKFEKFVF